MRSTTLLPTSSISVRRAAIFLSICALLVSTGKTFSQSLQPFFLMADNLQQQRSASISGGSQTRHLRTASDDNMPDPGRYPPVICPQFLQKIQSSSIEGRKLIDDPNNGALHGKQVMHKNDNKFFVSLHNEKFDPTRWGIMQYGHYYEIALSDAFVEVLTNSTQENHPVRVLDVGGNVGYFTLLSAANGPVIVDVWEPNEKNRLRMCEALLLNQFHSEYDSQYNIPRKNKKGSVEKKSEVNLYSYGVGRKEGEFTFVENINPGQGAVQETTPSGVAGSQALQVTTLDNFARERGWFESRPNIAILKVDVEGFEYSVIEGATELLKTKIVRNIFMEVSAREPQEISLNKPPLITLSEMGYKLHKIGGWRGPEREAIIPDDMDIAEYVMKETLAEEAKQLNLWWKLP